MNVIKNKYLILLVLLLPILSCQEQTQEKDRVSVSITPLKYFVDQISQGSLDVNVLIPPGSAPASFELNPSQMMELNKSKLLFIAGHLGFEKTKIKNWQSSNSGIEVISLSEKLDIMKSEGHDHGDHYHEGVSDPHIWMSVVNARIFSNTIYQALIKSFPGKKGIFSKGYTELMHKLDQLEGQLKQLMKPYQNREFIIFHPALGYFARDYQLKQIPIELDGKNPSPRQMQKVIDEALQKNIRSIFIQKEFDVENAKTISREIDAKVIQINPLSYEWSQSMLQIGKELSESFKP